MNPVLITFKTPYDPTLIQDWLVKSNMLGRMTYDWIRSEITFYSEEDALLFALMFNTTRKKTKIEEMLANEEDNH